MYILCHITTSGILKQLRSYLVELTKSLLVPWKQLTTFSPSRWPWPSLNPCGLPPLSSTIASVVSLVTPVMALQPPVLTSWRLTWCFSGGAPMVGPCCYGPLQLSSPSPSSTCTYVVLPHHLVLTDGHLNYTSCPLQALRLEPHLPRPRQWMERAARQPSFKEVWPRWSGCWCWQQGGCWVSRSLEKERGIQGVEVASWNWLAGEEGMEVVNNRGLDEIEEEGWPSSQELMEVHLVP